MRLVLLTALTMAAFAANSLLNRMALLDGSADPAAFAALRTASGAMMLWLLLAWRGRGDPQRATPRTRLVGAGSLALYMLGFSFAYITLDAGVGALILFGGVQVTMFAGAVIGGEAVPRRRWIGAALAFGGLVWLSWPGASGAPNPAGALLMTAAAIGWGIYSLAGRGTKDPLRATASNFLWAAPVGVLAWLSVGGELGHAGIALALASGMVTSGLGYALWYSVLPRLASSVAALAQLTVPVIAMLGGALLLAEPIGLRAALAAGLVLGGVAFGLLPQRTISSSAS